MRRPPDFICFIISFNSSSSHPQLGSGEWTGHVALGPSQYIENVGAPPPDTVGEVFDRCSAPVIFVADLVTKSSRTLASELMRNPLLIRDVAMEINLASWSRQYVLTSSLSVGERSDICFRNV
jgi:hypothetical protein